jgi:hypothetical protein
MEAERIINNMAENKGDEELLSNAQIHLKSWPYYEVGVDGKFFGFLVHLDDREE